MNLLSDSFAILISVTFSGCGHFAYFDENYLKLNSLKDSKFKKSTLKRISLMCNKGH